MNSMAQKVSSAVYLARGIFQSVLSGAFITRRDDEYPRLSELRHSRTTSAPSGKTTAAFRTICKLRLTRLTVQEQNAAIQAKNKDIELQIALQHRDTPLPPTEDMERLHRLNPEYAQWVLNVLEMRRSLAVKGRRA